MKILFTLILWYFWIPFDKTGYKQNAESIRTSINIVICSKISPNVSGFLPFDSLPKHESSVVHRFQRYLFHIQIQNSRDFKKSTPHYIVSCHFRIELWIAHDKSILFLVVRFVRLPDATPAQATSFMM